MAVIWTKQLSVGNETLDAEHKRLMGIVNGVEYAIQRRDAPALLRAIKQFMECARAHFENEERFMQVAGLPLDQHDLAHRHLEKELQSTWQELSVRKGLWIEHVMEHYPQFLREWLVGHILKEDMLMKEALQTRAYDFKPA